MSRDTAKKFWTTKEYYPRFGSKQRRFHELMWLVPKLEDVESLLDIGCGSGEFLDILTKITDIQKFHGCDISESLLDQVKPPVKTFVYDMYCGEKLFKTDAVLLWASLQYVFDDDTIRKLLSKLECRKLFVRTPCEKEDTIIDKYSVDLGDMYSSRYMTLDNLLKLLNEDFTIVDVSRAYPDSIESKFGSKQWLIECTKED